MDKTLRNALVHIRRINGIIGGYPAADGQRVLVLEYRGLRVRRFYLAWPEYLEAFAFWQELLDKPYRRYVYRRRHLDAA